MESIVYSFNSRWSWWRWYSDSGGTLDVSKLESSLITFFSIEIGIPILLLVLIYIIAVFYKVSVLLFIVYYAHVLVGKDKCS